MKISHIFKEVLNEDFKSQTKRFISQGIEPDLVTSYINKFKHIRDKKYKEMFDKDLDIEVPPERRNDIDAYTKFHDLEVLVDFVGGRRPISTNIDKTSKEEQIEVSGKAIFKDENFEVYYADNPRACIEYKGKFPYSWCVARSDSSNMFYTYRFKPYEPAFYFIKDIKAAEKEFGLWNMTKNVFKGKFDNPYHFFVIQVPKNAKIDDNTTQQYIVTSANNDGDKQMSWDEILQLNPTIAPIHEVLVPKPFTPEERQKHERFKNGISDNDFKKLSYEDKRSYLDIYPTIARPITSKQLVELPEDLLNLYVSFGIGLDDDQFFYIKKMPSILKRYTQISKKKLEEYLKRDNYQRRQLNLGFTELIVLSDEDIGSYLKSLSHKDINDFIHRYGDDKFEFLEKHLPDKFTPEAKNLRALLTNANEGNGEALAKLQEMVPSGVELRFYNGYLIIDTADYGSYVKDNVDNSKMGLYDMLDWNSYSGGYNNDYFDGDEDNLNSTYEHYLEEIITNDTQGFAAQLKSIGLDWNLASLKDLLASYKKEDEIHSTISQEYSNAKEHAEDKAWGEISDKIKSIVYINDRDVEINIGALVLFTAHNAFFNTDRQIFIDNVIHLLENILDDYDVASDEHAAWEEVNEAGYNHMVIDEKEIINDINREIENAIELITAENGETSDDGEEIGGNTAKLKSQIIKSLNDTLKSLGQDEFAKTIENDIVRIDIDRQKFNLSGKVFIKLTDKKTGETHDGFVFIKDIPSYFTNYKLFEQLSRIKSLIRF